MSDTTFFSLLSSAVSEIDDILNDRDDHSASDLAKKVASVIGIDYNDTFNAELVSVKKGYYPVTHTNIGTAIIVTLQGDAMIHIGFELEAKANYFEVIQFDSSKPLFFHDCDKFLCLVIPVIPNKSMKYANMFHDQSVSLGKNIYKDSDNEGVRVVHSHPKLTTKRINLLHSELLASEGRVRGVIYESGEHAFNNAKDAEESFDLICEELGFKVHEDSISVFVPIKQYINPHKDSVGSCMAICVKGSGTFFYDNKGRMESVEFNKGSMLFFDDTSNHFVQCKNDALFLAGNVQN